MTFQNSDFWIFWDTLIVQVLFVQCDVTKEEELVRYVEKMCLIVKLGDTLSLLCTLQDVRRVRGIFQGQIFSKKEENCGKECK